MRSEEGGVAKRTRDERQETFFFLTGQSLLNPPARPES